MKIEPPVIVKNILTITFRDFRAYMRWVGWRWAVILAAVLTLSVTLSQVVSLGLNKILLAGIENFSTDSSILEGISFATLLLEMSILMIVYLVLVYLSGALTMRALVQHETHNLHRSYDDVFIRHGVGYFWAYLGFLLLSCLFIFLLSALIMALVSLLTMMDLPTALLVLVLAALASVWIYFGAIIMLRQYLRVFVFAVSCFDPQQDKKELRDTLKTQVLKGWRNNRPGTFVTLLLMLLLFFVFYLISTILFSVVYGLLPFTPSGIDITAFAIPESGFIAFSPNILRSLLANTLISPLVWFQFLFFSIFWATACGTLFSQLRRASE